MKISNLKLGGTWKTHSSGDILAAVRGSEAVIFVSREASPPAEWDGISTWLYAELRRGTPGIEILDLHRWSQLKLALSDRIPLNPDLHDVGAEDIAFSMFPAVCQGGDHWTLPGGTLLDADLAEAAARELELNDAAVPVLAFDANRAFEVRGGELRRIWLNVLWELEEGRLRIVGLYAASGVGGRGVSDMDPTSEILALHTLPLIVELEGELGVVFPRDQRFYDTSSLVLYPADLKGHIIPMDDLSEVIAGAASPTPATTGNHLAFPPGDNVRTRVVAGICLLHDQTVTIASRMDDEPLDAALSSCGVPPITELFSKARIRPLREIYVARDEEGLRISSEGGGEKFSVAEMARGLTDREIAERVSRSLGVDPLELGSGFVWLVSIVGGARRRVETPPFEVLVNPTSGIAVEKGAAPAEFAAAILAQDGSLHLSRILADSHSPRTVGLALMGGRCLFSAGDIHLVRARVRDGEEWFVSAEPVTEAGAGTGDTDVIEEALSSLSGSSPGAYSTSVAGALAVWEAIGAAGGVFANAELGPVRVFAAAWERGDGGSIASRIVAPGWAPRYQSLPHLLIHTTAASRNPWFVVGAAGSPLVIDAPAWVVGYPFDLLVALDEEDTGVYLSHFLPSYVSATPFSDADKLKRYLKLVGAVPTSVDATPSSIALGVPLLELAAAEGLLVSTGDGRSALGVIDDLIVWSSPGGSVIGTSIDAILSTVEASFSDYGSLLDAAGAVSIMRSRASDRQ